MIRLASLIKQHETDFLARYGQHLLPSQRNALAAIKSCRSVHSPRMKTACNDCQHTAYVPHSCGHRHCPHCQAHESQAWIDKQCQKCLPADYFMMTFTLPKELRPLAYAHQRQVYSLLFKCAWDTLRTFSLNDKSLAGTPGMVAVLHTHSRRLDYHPHLHTLIPAAAIHKKQRLWRKKTGGYLFPHKAIAKVFRAKMLQMIQQLGLTLPFNIPEKWVVNVKQVGSGDKAIIYLGRYLYRGVIQEKDILSHQQGKVTFRYTESKTQQVKTRTIDAVDFIWLVLKHVLPQRFRRSRDYGLLHPNSKKLIQVLYYQLKLALPISKPRPRPVLRCPCCGGTMAIVQTRIRSKFSRLTAVPIAGATH